MHGAPAVTYPVGRSRFQGWLLALAGALGAVVGLMWCIVASPMSWQQPLFVFVFIAFSVMAVRQWRDSPSGNLRWDGQDWDWNRQRVSTRGYLTVHLDFQFCLLLCLHSQREGRIWLWPQREDRVARWSDLRRAVYSNVPSDEMTSLVPDHDLSGGVACER